MAFYLQDVPEFMERALEESAFMLFLCARFHDIPIFVLMCVPTQTCLVAYLGFYSFNYHIASMLKSYFVPSTHCLQLFVPLLSFRLKSQLSGLLSEKIKRGIKYLWTRNRNM